MRGVFDPQIAYNERGSRNRKKNNLNQKTKYQNTETETGISVEMLLVLSMVVSFFSLSFFFLTFSFFYIFVLDFYSEALCYHCFMIKARPSTLLLSRVYSDHPLYQVNHTDISIFINTPRTLQSQDVLFFFFFFLTLSGLLFPPFYMWLDLLCLQGSRTRADRARLPEHPI